MNPNSQNLSFALEQGRSIWTEYSLTAMVQGLGTNVGADHLNLSVCVVKQVPYIWDANSGDESFLDLTDTPASYAGAAGYVVAVNSGETGLIFQPAPAGSNAFAFVEGDSGTTIEAIGSSTLIFTGTNGITISTDDVTNTVTVAGSGSGGSDSFLAISAPATLLLDQKYFVTNTGTITLPILTGAEPAGSAVRVTKVVGNTVMINVGSISNEIVTDLGNTNILELDSNEEVLLISNGTTWQLQIGSTS